MQKVQRANRFLDKEEIEQIVTLYRSGKNSTQIAPIFGVAPASICRHLKKLGVIRSISEAKREYSLNESFFERIDSHKKAQILGMIGADGNVGSSRNTFEITLQGRDEQYVAHIKNALEYTGPLQYRNKGLGRIYPRLSIVSTKLRQDLINIGIAPRKSARQPFPTVDQVPKEFVNSYVLGYFEGDGHISVVRSGPYNTLHAHVHIICSLDFGNKLKEIVAQELGITSYVRPIKKEREYYLQVYRFEIGGPKQVLKFCQWMYANATFHIQRKLKRYQFLSSHFDSDGNFIRDPDWAKKASDKIKGTRQENGTRAGRIPKVFGTFVSPEGKVYSTSRFHDFGRELGINGGVLYRMLKGTYKAPYKGWTIATPDQIAAARESGTLIEKHY